MENENVRTSFLGDAGRSIGLTLIGGLLLAVIINAISSPQERARESDQELATDIANLRGEVDELRKEYQEHRVAIDSLVARLEIQVEQGTIDRYTARDATALKELLAERQQGNERELARLDRTISAITQYLTEERRWQEYERNE